MTWVHLSSIENFVEELLRTLLHQAIAEGLRLCLVESHMLIYLKCQLDMAGNAFAPLLTYRPRTATVRNGLRSLQ